MSKDVLPKKSRKRPTVVCRRCRRKKAKCNRQLPCDLCVQALCPHECLYETSIASLDPIDRASPASIKKSLSLLPNLPKQFLMAYPHTCQVVSAKKNRQIAYLGESNMMDIEPNQLLFQAAVSLMFAFCQDLGVGSGHYTSKRLKKNMYMIGEKPSLTSLDIMNLHMNLSSLIQFSRAESALELPVLIESRFANAFLNFKVSLRTTFFVKLSQQDPAIRIYWEHNTCNKELKLMTIQQLAPTRRSEVLKAAGKHFGSLFLSDNRLSEAMTKTQLSSYGCSLGFTFTPSYNEQEGFQVSLHKVIPPKPVLLAYLARFFAEIYPLYPIIDEGWLFAQASRLFNFSGLNATFHSANLTTRDDVITVSIVLFIMGLSYHSYFTNIRAKNEDNLDHTVVGDAFLKRFPVSKCTIELALSMLLKGKSRFKPLFLLLQAHTLKVIYKMHSLDNESAYCDIDGVSGASSLLLLAVSLMLERDPDAIVNFPGDLKERNLRRKLWYTLLQIEYSMSYLFLTPRTISLTMYKTRLPTFDSLSSNISDLFLEEKTINQLRKIHAIYSQGNAILDLTIDAVLPIHSTNLITTLNEFEIRVKENLGVIDDFFIQHKSGSDTGVIYIAQFKALLSLRLFISFVNYFLYLYYLYKGDQRLSFFFFKKTLLTHMNEFMYLSSELIFCQELYFNASFAFMMSPLMIVAKQSSLIFCLALEISLRCGLIMLKYTGDKSKDIFLMKELLKFCQSIIMRQHRFFKVLSERYLYAWKCVKINSFGCKLLADRTFFKVDPQKIAQAAYSFTNEQTIDLLSCIRESCPINISDENGFEDQCYQRITSGYDADATGVDLYKTLQTDNFWIILNTLAEREYASQFLSGIQPNPNLESLHPSEPSVTGPKDDVAQRCVLDTSIDAALLEPNTLQILDMEMFSTNWGREKIDGHDTVL